MNPAAAVRFPSWLRIRHRRRPALLLLPPLLLLLFQPPHALAQRETFEASDYRREAAISKALDKAPARPVKRAGAAPDGRRVTVTATDVSVAFRNVHFKLDSTELRDKSSEAQVAEMASALKKGKLRFRRFLIEGHTCDLGEERYNLRLSARRAEAIRQRLCAAGVEPERLAVIGLGESEPIATPGRRADAALAESIRSANRRVVLRLLPEPPVTAPKPKR